MANEERKVTKAEEAVVRATDLPFSLKHSTAVCRFIKNKTPDEAISLLSDVLKKKVAVPMPGQIPHKKGMMSGRYPAKATESFIKLIKNAVANASVKGMDINNLVLEGIANKGTTIHHGGRRRGESKRTNILIRVKERKK